MAWPPVFSSTYKRQTPQIWHPAIRAHRTTRLIITFHVFARTDDQTTEKSQTDVIVEKLMSNKLNVDHSIYMDNFYNYYTLSKKLLDRQTFCTAILSKKRKDNPLIVTSKKNWKRPKIFHDIEMESILANGKIKEKFVNRIGWRDARSWY